eukprot:5722597-Amphidinium_carterae.1
MAGSPSRRTLTCSPHPLTVMCVPCSLESPRGTCSPHWGFARVWMRIKIAGDCARCGVATAVDRREEVDSSYDSYPGLTEEEKEWMYPLMVEEYCHNVHGRCPSTNRRTECDERDAPTKRLELRLVAVQLRALRKHEY